MLGERGPMDRFEQACQEAKALDVYLRAEGNDASLDDARQLVYSLELNSALITQEVEITGCQLTPFLDDDGDVAGVDFSAKQMRSKGEYLGFQVMPVDTTIEGEPIGIQALHVVHMLKTDTVAYTDRAGGKHVTEVSLECLVLILKLYPKAFVTLIAMLILSKIQPVSLLLKKLT